MKVRSEAQPTDDLAANTVIVLPRAAANTPNAVPSTESAPSIALAVQPNLQAVVVPSVTNEPTLLRTASLTGGKTIRRIEPRYPSLALQRRIQGDVVLRAHISKNGKVVDIRQVKGDPILGAAARAAVRQWRYEPFRRDNVPQEMDTTITLQFRLSQGY